MNYSRPGRALDVGESQLSWKYLHTQMRPLDFYFAETLSRFAGEQAKAVWLAASLVSQKCGEGHVCISLKEFAGQTIFASEEFQGVKTPPLDTWRSALLGSGVAGSERETTPLVLDGSDRLYLHRYWRHETDVEETLIQRSRAAPTLDLDKLREGLCRLFPAQKGTADHQKIAAALALLKPFAVIAGGPGTGKTTTVVKILALLQEQACPEKLEIALTAPTGKAAARLSEAIKTTLAQLCCDERIKESLPGVAMTLHRLLKVRSDGASYGHHAGRPLTVDVLVVDEASMIDLPLMAALLTALPETARLILLGDMDQLISVEAGNLLADICGAGQSTVYSLPIRDQLLDLCGPGIETTESVESVGLADNIAVLHTSHRFEASSGIGDLSRAINAGDVDFCWRLFDSKDDNGVAWRHAGNDQLREQLAQAAVRYYSDYLDGNNPAEMLRRLNRFRILCALREGPFGVEQVNRWVEQALERAGLIRAVTRIYAGRPIISKRNRYSLGLFNGDTGIFWPDETSENRIRAFFPQADGSVRKILPARLPEHETAYATTVHKSQGSEFENILLLLPDNLSPVLTRELIYTAVTRARKTVEVWGDRTIFESAIKRRIKRSSGLRDKLWGYP